MIRTKFVKKFSGPAMLLIFGVLGAALILPAPAAFSSDKDDVPAHHTAPPKEALPNVLDSAQFKDGLTQNSYAMAAKIRPVLYEQPCYCFCDRTDSHTSLLDCFVGMHATTCNICRMEGIYAYEQTRMGQTPEQIRKAIIRGDWKKLNPKDYATVKDLK
jgi:Protein of unknown function with PCYCGC motif